MASLLKKSDTYYCQFFYERRRHTFTVGKVTRTQAEARAERVGRLLGQLERGERLLPEGADIVDFVLADGDARKLQKIAEAPPRPSAVLTLEALRDQYLATHRGAQEENSLATVRMHFGHFIESMGARFHVREMTTQKLQEHIDRRKAEKALSPVTLKKEMATLRAAWNWAAHTGRLSGPFPGRGLVYPKQAEKPPFQTFAEIEKKVAGGLSHAEAQELWESLYLTQPEIAELLDYVKARAEHGWIYPAVSFAAHTGARRSEVLRVRVHDLDLSGETVLIHEKKRARGRRTTRRVPLSPFLVGVLKDWLADHPGGPYLFCHAGEVFRSKKRSQTTGHQSEKVRPSSLKARMATVRKRELPAQGALTRDEAHDHLQRTLFGGKWAVLRGWHVLRHSFVSLCASKGIDQRLIDEWVGHTTEEMRKRYRHLFPSTQRDAMRSVFA